jgi:hypothetical protein
MEKEIGWAITGVLLLAAGLFGLEKVDRLKAKGKKVKGIVFKNNLRYSSGHSSNQMRTIYHPVVRFLTEDNVWITQELNIGVNPPMREGKEVNLLYNPQDPEEVILSNTLYTVFFPWGLTLAGIIILATACLDLLDITNYIK